MRLVKKIPDLFFFPPKRFKHGFRFKKTNLIAQNTIFPDKLDVKDESICNFDPTTYSK